MMRCEFQLLDIREVDGEPLLVSDDWGDNLLALLTTISRLSRYSAMPPLTAWNCRGWC